MMDHGGGMMIGGMMMWPWMILVAALVIAALIALILVIIRLAQGERLRTHEAKEDSARRILDERYARGEIDHDEYRTRRQALA